MERKDECWCAGDAGRWAWDLPVEDEARHVLDCDEGSNYRPVHAPPLEVRLGERTVCEGLPCAVARQEEGKPGTVHARKGHANAHGDLQVTRAHTSEHGR